LNRLNKLQSVLESITASSNKVAMLTLFRRQVFQAQTLDDKPSCRTPRVFEEVAPALEEILAGRPDVRTIAILELIVYNPALCFSVLE
jgi:hypothetical protein